MIRYILCFFLRHDPVVYKQRLDRPVRYPQYKHTWKQGVLCQRCGHWIQEVTEVPIPAVIMWGSSLYGMRRLEVIELPPQEEMRRILNQE